MAKKVITRKAHQRKGYIRRDGVKVGPTKVKVTRYKVNTKKPLKVLIAHDNRLGYPTTKAHKFAERLGRKKEFNVIMDKHHWAPQEKTSNTETNRREKLMVKKADLIVRIVNPPSKTGTNRHDGALSEVRKGINAVKPVMELYERGARESPTRSIRERNYKKRVKINLKPNETLDKGFSKGMDKLKKNEIL